MGTFERWRRAFGAIKDSTTLGLAKVSSDFKVFRFFNNIDIAIVKATNHEECPPKDLHVRRIVVGTSFVVPRADVGYCIHTLSRRLMKTKNWIVALKTLIVFHRILREGDPSFREELLTYSRRQPFLQIPDFRDESSQLAWDCSSWIRTYGLFLVERLECYRVLGFDIEMERLTTAPGLDKPYSRTRVMNIDELLDQLPAMQQLLHRLMGCQPEGAACHNGLIQHALALVLKESIKIYNVIDDGISRLVELFFDLPRDDAVNALNIYKRAEKQVENLGDFYNLRKHQRPAMNMQLPKLNQPPQSFLATMEEYVRGASLNGLDSIKNLEHQEVLIEDRSRETEEVEIKEVGSKEVENKDDQEQKSKPIQKVEEVLPLIVIDDDDCHNMNQTSTKAVELDDSIPWGSYLTATGTPSLGWSEIEKPSSFELAVVTLPSNNTNISQIEPVLDRRLLYSLYEDEMAKKQKQNESDMQTIVMQQQIEQQPYQQYQDQCQQWYQHQQNMLAAYNRQHSSSQYLQQISNPKSNQFGDGIKYPQGNHGLL